MTPPTPEQLIAEARDFVAGFEAEEMPYGGRMVERLTDALASALQRIQELEQRVKETTDAN